MHAELIKTLGGLEAVAKLCGIPGRVKVVSNWPQRGIPYRYRPIIAAELKKRKREKDIPKDFLDMTKAYAA